MLFICYQFNSWTNLFLLTILSLCNLRESEKEIDRHVTSNIWTNPRRRLPQFAHPWTSMKYKSHAIFIASDPCVSSVCKDSSFMLASHNYTTKAPSMTYWIPCTAPHHTPPLFTAVTILHSFRCPKPSVSCGCDPSSLSCVISFVVIVPLNSEQL
jgi:hypothetical protein